MASAPPGPPPTSVAVASFANMFSVGAVYALGLLHAHLPRLLDMSSAARYTPFAMASLGLAAGVTTSASLITSAGPHATMAFGTALWGLGVAAAGISLQNLSLGPLMACLVVAGVGVGWTYLAVVVAVGRAFPDLPTARSAIGPLGFASGAAMTFYASSVLEADTAEAVDYGRALVSTGLGLAAVGGVTKLLIPDVYRPPQPVADKAKTETFGRRGFYITLLFFNALPGMTALAALPETVPSAILPLTMVALAVSGPLSPYVLGAFGFRNVFVELLCLRGVLLIALSVTGHGVLGLVALCAVLFGHGMGFGVIPAVVKGESASPDEFVGNYGLVLGAWGVSGMVACMVNAALLPSSPDGISAVSGTIGLVTLMYGVFLGVTL